MSRLLPSAWMVPAADTYFQSMLDRDPRGFEMDHLDMVISHCRRFRTAVDGGAHIGTWSVELSGRFERVMAFEPAADTFACLRRNIAACSNVYPKNVALGERAGRAKIVDDVTRSGNTGSRYMIDAPGEADVDVKPLDFYELVELDLLKLDVEGSELLALRGAEQTIKRCKPVIMIEVKRLRPGHDPEAAVRWLNANGYREVARARNDRVYVPAE